MNTNHTEKRDITRCCIDALLNSGAEKAQVMLIDSEKSEFNVKSGKITLLRTTGNYRVTLTGITGGKKGTVIINQVDKPAIEQGAGEAVKAAQSSMADEANDIAEFQEPKEFSSGPGSADFDTMYTRISDFLETVQKKYPAVLFEEAILEFTRTNNYFMNSNGVDLVSEQGKYRFVINFAAKEGKKSTSFNYTGVSLKDLEKNLYELCSVQTLLKQSEEHLETRVFPGKITGDVIMTPDCLYEFLFFLTEYLGDQALISGTSIYKDKLNSQAAGSLFTLQTNPLAPELAENYYFTGDGYEAQNSTIFEKGILKSFLLSLYGSKKTGLERAANSGHCFVVEPGNTEVEKIVQSVKKGILLCRFSGGMPGKNGDFSGVAKNSFYIENGSIQYPLQETMVGGNIAKMFNSIKDISAERLNFGGAILPWIQFEGLTISGK